VRRGRKEREKEEKKKREKEKRKRVRERERKRSCRRNSRRRPRPDEHARRSATRIALRGTRERKGWDDENFREGFRRIRGSDGKGVV